MTLCRLELRYNFSGLKDINVREFLKHCSAETLRVDNNLNKMINLMFALPYFHFFGGLWRWFRAI